MWQKLNIALSTIDKTKASELKHTVIACSLSIVRITGLMI